MDKIEEVCQNQTFWTKLDEIGKKRQNWTGLETWTN